MGRLLRQQLAAAGVGGFFPNVRHAHKHKYLFTDERLCENQANTLPEIPTCVSAARLAALQTFRGGEVPRKICAAPE